MNIKTYAQDLKDYLLTCFPERLRDFKPLVLKFGGSRGREHVQYVHVEFEFPGDHLEFDAKAIIERINAREWLPTKEFQKTPGGSNIFTSKAIFEGRFQECQLTLILICEESPNDEAAGD